MYLGFPDESFPVDHPRQWLGPYAVGAVPYDGFPPGSPMRRRYEWQPLTDFVAAVLGLDVVYRYADPLGALNVAVMRDGDELQWHFDQTEFVVSLALQERTKAATSSLAADPRRRTTNATTTSPACSPATANRA